MLRRHREWVHAFVYIIPSFVIICVFQLIPIGMDIFYSFTKYNMVQKPEWIWLQNYITMFRDVNFLTALKNTVYYTLITVPLQTIFALILAAIIAEWFQNAFGLFIKSALFVPVIASSVLIGTIWVLLLSGRGPINGLLGFFHIPPVSFLGRTETALPTIAAVAIWKNVGYFLVICYAGIMDIPQSLYEAAKVDGATVIQRFRYIVIPCLSSIIYLIVTLGIIWSFQVFDLAFIMTNGGPGYSSQTLVLTIYQKAFKEIKMGYATSMAVILLFIVLIISIIQRKLQRDGTSD
jgi:multiple sugar transport system permease protein